MIYSVPYALLKLTEGSGKKENYIRMWDTVPEIYRPLQSLSWLIMTSNANLRWALEQELEGFML